MKNKIKISDVVALSEDLPEHSLLKGQVGTVVEVHSKDSYEVEFSDNLGKTYALLPINSSILIPLYFSPAIQKRIYV